MLAAGIIAIVFSLLAVALQFFEYTTLDFGAAQGGVRVGVLRLDGDVRDRGADRASTGSRCRSPACGACAGRATREIEIPAE